MKKTYFMQIVIISSILLTIGMACRLTGAIFPGLAKNVPTETPLPAATEIFVEPQPTIEIAPDAITISFSESDVLGWIKQYQQSQTDVLLNDPSVKLDNGLAQISATIEAGFISGKLDVSFSVNVDDQGNPVVSVASMKLADVDVPQAFQEQLAAAINDAIASSIVEQLGGRTIQSIVIDDGRMTIVTGN